MTSGVNNAFHKQLVQKGKLFFWIGSLMATSALTWLFDVVRDNDITTNSITLPATFLSIGIMLAVAFKDCQFDAK